ncbi:MAG: hypothetical protein ACK5QB_16170, partial [Pseudanabaena sp.]
AKIQESLIKLIKKGLSRLAWDSLSSDVRKSLKELVNLISSSDVIYITHITQKSKKVSGSAIPSKIAAKP